MNNNDNDNMARGHYVFLDFLAERKRKEQQDQETDPAYETYNDEVLTYPVFSNHACHDHDARELLGKPIADDYCRRWLHFHTPDTQKLPHAAYAHVLVEQKADMCKQLASLNAPRLAVFSAAIFFIVILTARGHFMLPLLPIALTACFWLYTESSLRHKRQQLVQHTEHLQDLSLQYQELNEQLECLPPAAPATQFAQLYQRAIGQLLHKTLSSLLHPHELDDLPAALRQRQWPAFALESWGILQAPLKATPKINEWLLAEENRLSLAFQPAAGKQAALYRITYLQLWILTERGLAMGSGYYDRVADQYIHTRHEFLPYTDLVSFHLSEEILPESPELKQCMPETVYHQHFRKPVQVLTLETNRGKTYAYAAALAHEMRHSQTASLETVGLNPDLQQFKRLLHEKLYMRKAS
jgi:hypothetical protein